MEQIPCPDGYLLDVNSPLAGGHHALNQYLVRVEEAGWQTALKEINAIRDKGRKLQIWKALLERMRWLQEQRSESPCLSPLRGLAERIERWTLAPTEADLLEILERAAAAAGFVAPYTPMPHLLAYVEEHGLSPALAQGIRTFRERVDGQSLTVNQTSLQLFRSRLDMLAWRDEWTPIDLKRCWSEQIRADFRAMQGAGREAWRRLLYSIHGDEGTRPAPRWLAAAEGIVGEIGVQEFRATLLGWLAPLRRGSTQKLSREGSYLLRSLIWLSEPLKDPELLARIEEICEVQFKPKANGQKVVRAAAEAAGRPDPGAAAPGGAAVSLDALVSRALSAVLAPGSSLLAPALGSRVEVRGDTAYVRGDLDTYEVNLSSGAAFRGSDGRQVRVSSKVAWPIPGGLPDIAGITSLLGMILALTEDAKYVPELAAADE